MVIAEIGTSHNGSLQKAKELIDGAKASGADAVKFQWVYADEILHPDTGFVNLPTGRIPLYDRFKTLECPLSFYRNTLDYARASGLKWICSPFGLRSLSELLSIKPDAVKVASPELNHFPMLKEIARAAKDSTGENKLKVIISSGVSKLKDIEAALDILGTKDVTLLHCITSYPAPEEEYNVRLISSLGRIFGIDCGLSDHSLDPVLVPCLAVSQGATVIEKHITLSKTTDGLDDPVALTLDQFSQMTQAVRQSQVVMAHYGKKRGKEEIIRQMCLQFGEERVAKVLGTGVKTLAPSEKANYGRTNRSLHYMRDLEAGQIVGAEDIGILRTEKVLTPGLGPEFMENILGKKTSRPVKSGSGLLMEDFMN